MKDESREAPALVQNPDDPVLAEIVRRLVETYHPERIYLFGSSARGDSGPDSDYDLMVVVADETPQDLQSSSRTHEALRGIKASADVLVWTRGAFDKRLHLKASLPSTILREGRLVYGMVGDRVRAEDTRAWLVKAHQDLRGAEIALAATPPLLGHVVFDCQQAVEKVFKGFLTWHDRPFGKTHDLGDLAGLCSQIEPSLEAVALRAEPLTDYAWKFRYPGKPAEPTRAEAEKSLALAREVVAAILSRLPPEVHP